MAALCQAKLRNYSTKKVPESLTWLSCHRAKQQQGDSSPHVSDFRALSLSTMMGPPHPPGVTPGNLGGCLEEVVLEQSLERQKIQTSEDTWRAEGGKGYVYGYVWIWI